MAKFGPFDERELADKLVNISMVEIQNFDKIRRKKLRIYYVIAVILGIASVLLLIFKFEKTGLVAAVIGFLLLSYGVYKRMMWIRLYENLVYMKKQRENSLKDAEKGQPKSRKFSSL